MAAAPSDAMVFKTGFPQRFWFVDVTAIEEYLVFHVLAKFRKIDISKFIPFSD